MTATKTAFSKQIGEKLPENKQQNLCKYVEIFFCSVIARNEAIPFLGATRFSLLPKSVPLSTISFSVIANEVKQIVEYFSQSQ